MTGEANSTTWRQYVTDAKHGEPSAQCSNDGMAVGNVQHERACGVTVPDGSCIFVIKRALV